MSSVAREAYEKHKFNKKGELDFIVNFAAEAVFENGISSDILRSLWTAYCMHYELYVDTYEYDQDLYEVWCAVSEEDTGGWGDFESFGNYMCEYVV